MFRSLQPDYALIIISVLWVTSPFVWWGFFLGGGGVSILTFFPLWKLLSYTLKLHIRPFISSISFVDDKKAHAHWIIFLPCIGILVPHLHFTRIPNSFWFQIQHTSFIEWINGICIFKSSVLKRIEFFMIRVIKCFGIKY